MRWPDAAAATTCAWCGISCQAPGTRHERRLRQRHARGGTAAAVLERAEQRAEQLPARPAAGRGPGLRWRPRSRGRGTGWPAGGRRSPAARPGAWRRRWPRRSTGSSSSAGTSTPADSSRSRRSAPGRLGDLGVLGEQREQGGVARGGPGQDRRDAVEALELLGFAASVALSSAFTRARSSRTSRATTWNFVRTEGLAGPAPDGGLHLAHDPGEHGDEALVVMRAGALGAWGMASSGLTLALSSQEHLPQVSGTQDAGRGWPRAQPWCRAHGTSSSGHRRCVHDDPRSHGSRTDRRDRPDDLSPAGPPTIWR